MATLLKTNESGPSVLNGAECDKAVGEAEIGFRAVVHSATRSQLAI